MFLNSLHDASILHLFAPNYECVTGVFNMYSLEQFEKDIQEILDKYNGNQWILDRLLLHILEDESLSLQQKASYLRILLKYKS